MNVIIEQTKPATKGHIFLIGEDETHSMLLDYIQSKDSVFKFSGFQSGEDCLNNLYLEPVVIILDYSLPGMSGYDILLEIKKYNSNIRVLILSTHENMRLALSLLEAGADVYLLKEYEARKQIIKELETILDSGEMKDTDEIQKNMNIAPALPQMKNLFYVI